MNSKGGKKLKAGDTVAYVICDDGSQLAATQRAFHVDEVRESQELKVDINYYLAQQLHPVVSRLCDPLEATDAARIAQSLGLDPEQVMFNFSKLLFILYARWRFTFLCLLASYLLA